MGYNKLEVSEMFSLDQRAADKNGVIKRIHMIPDEKVPDAVKFIIWLEDHTLGNALRMELLRNDNVLFAGYKVPHPLDHMIELRVQTVPKSSPEAALKRAVANLRAEMKSMLDQFDEGVIKCQEEERRRMAPVGLEDDVEMKGASSPSPEDRLEGAGEGDRFQDQLDQLERQGPG